VAPDDGAGTACIDENAVLDFVQGRLDATAVARIDEHADGCASCRSAIEEAVRAFRERATTGLEHDDEPMVTRFSAGDKLAGRYRIIRFIARGGMGEVYEAEDEMLGTHIAVKTVAATISDNPLAARRLKQEVNLARRITHPNVCRIFDLGVHQSGAERSSPVVLFITMELVAGISLAQRLREGGPFSPAAALPIVRAMAAAIGAAHRAGVVHRDFKSDNVMLAGDGDGVRVVVMDFGLARGTSLSTHDSLEGRGLAGTLAYMAPEQLDGQRAGAPVDIYALGVVMFEMLAGRLPFVPPPGEPGLSAVLNRLSEPAPPLRSLLPTIDARWNDVVARCLEREADRRLASADDVERALADASGDVPAPATVARSEAPATAVAPAAVAAPSASTAPPAMQHAGWRKAGYITAGLAGLVAAALVLRYLPSEPTPATSAPASVAPPAAPPAIAPAPREAEPHLEPPAVMPSPKIATGTAPAAPTDRAEAAPAGDRPPAARRPSAPRPFRRDQPAAAPKRATSAPAPSAPDAEPPKPAKPPHRSADPDDGFIFQ
jgi:tRNA A-37 threonylcarbamoyl transferase component Bud32